jgi:xylulokinase
LSRKKTQNNMLLLGYDLGSSSVKASIIDADSGSLVASAFYPKKEMEILASKPGWAEQDPELWWKNLKLATSDVLSHENVSPDEIAAIGISYQMHGLVTVDKDYNILRPSIIWCDSRAVETGDKAFNELGSDVCLGSLLNSPGNFTASKLKWVMDNEPAVYEKIHKVMLPGDYLALRMTGIAATTVSGLSEGMFWNFGEHAPAQFLLDYYGIDPALIPDIVPTFAEQGGLSIAVAEELGLKSGIPVSYRAGDQPNNAFSLNVLNPGEIAATAGTSGVVYGVSDKIRYDPESRVNTFAHVNHEQNDPRLGVLLCINGTGILNSWLKKNMVFPDTDYDGMNQMASGVPIGARGLTILPFGNGAERMLGNVDLGSTFSNLNFNIHSKSCILRAAQEGIVFSFHYGMEIMKLTGIQPSVIRAGHANMFLSPLFRETLSGLSGALIELYDTDGSQGAARGAGIGSKCYSGNEDAFRSLTKIKEIEPNITKHDQYLDAYHTWQSELDKALKV